MPGRIRVLWCTSTAVHACQGTLLYPDTGVHAGQGTVALWYADTGVYAGLGALWCRGKSMLVCMQAKAWWYPDAGVHAGLGALRYYGTHLQLSMQAKALWYTDAGVHAGFGALWHGGQSMAMLVWTLSPQLDCDLTSACLLSIDFIPLIRPRGGGSRGVLPA